MNQTVRQILEDFSLEDYFPIFKRDLSLGEPLKPRRGNFAKVITGMRRSGKTYRLLQEMQHLIESGVRREQILFFNFEDDRIAPATTKTGDEVLEAFRAMHPEAFEDGIYLFLDEVQEMDGWDRWLRRVIDTTKASVYATGSSSKLLSEDVASAFRGRSISFELLPYSFKEFARLNDSELAEYATNGHMNSTSRSKLGNLFREYIEVGGFPAIQDLTKPQRIATLQSYVQILVAKDVVERHGIENSLTVSAFAQKLLASSARELSIRKTENIMRSQGMNVGRPLLSRCLQYFEDAFLVCQVRTFGRSLSQKTTASPKVYAIDPGLALANSPAPSQDLGQRFEDAVYLELRRRSWGTRNGSISSYRTRAHGCEIDFVVGDALEESPTQLVQACLDMSEPATRDREIRALAEAMTEIDIDKAIIVLQDGTREEIELECGKIECIPAIDWFLE